MSTMQDTRVTPTFEFLVVPNGMAANDCCNMASVGGAIENLVLYIFSLLSCVGGIGSGWQ